MKRTAAAIVLLAILGGCVAHPRPGIWVPPGVIYVEPTYAVPGPGYYWDYRPNVGWGWRHPEHGWHRR